MIPAILRTLAVLLLVLGASLPAHAHNASAHHPEEQGSSSSQAGTYRAEAGTSFSQSCPGVPGHMCCCSLVAVSSAAKLSAVAAPTWRLVFASVARHKVQLPSLTPPTAEEPSQARPRAPPVSS